jgi:hypothetical protein
MPEDSHTYYKRRAAEELAAMERASGPAAEAHKLLAARYSLLAEEMAAAPKMESQPTRQ